MKKGLSAISPLLKAMSKNLGLEKEIKLFRLKEGWPDIVGPAIASHTAPQAIRHHVMTLHVDGAAWLHELSFLKGEILQKINRNLGNGSVRSLRLKIGPVSTPKKSEQSDSPQKKKTPLSKEAQTLVREQVSSVSDDALKRAIQKAMVHHLEKT